MYRASRRSKVNTGRAAEPAGAIRGRAGNPVSHAAGGALAEARLGCRGGLRVSESMFHVQFYLLVRDMMAGHRRLSVWSREAASIAPSRPRAGARKDAAPPGLIYGRATPSPRSDPAAVVVVPEAAIIIVAGQPGPGRPSCRGGRQGGRGAWPGTSGCLLARAASLLPDADPLG